MHSANVRRRLDLLVRPSASAGIGAIVLGVHHHVTLAFRVEAGLELIAVTGHDPFTGASGHAERWSFGFQQGLDFAWIWSAPLGFVAGVEANETPFAPAIDVRRTVAARIPWLEIAADAGLRVLWP